MTLKTAVPHLNAALSIKSAQLPPRALGTDLKLRRKNVSGVGHVHSGA